MTPEQLKASILQLAIQGKLVPQHPEDGSAEDLYQQIQREKKKLITAGKLKKEKPLPPITEEEIPFDIPESWKWVRLPEIVYNVGDKTNQILAKEVKKEGAYPAISQGQELVDGYTDKSEKVVCDLPLVMFGDHTRNVKYVDFPFVISADGTKFMKAICVAPKYLYYWMKCAAERLRNRGYARHFSLLKKELVPLPPLAEQRRIVEKIEQMLPLVEQYGEAYTALESLDARFPDDMRKSILQYAIQGKLVPQRPEEGTAEDLYQQIQKEKKKLIATGKLKKEKPLPPITEEEIPFDIPDSWKWCRIGEIFALQAGKFISADKISAKEREGLFPCYGGNGRRGYVDKYNREGDFPLIGRQGALCGNIKRAKGKFYATEHAVVVDTYAKTNVDWACAALTALNLNKYATATAQPGLAVSKIMEGLVPLPPLFEQQRIVEKLQQILPQIRQTSTTSLRCDIKQIEYN